MSLCTLCLFLTVPSNGLQSVIGAFPGHSHLFFVFSVKFNCFVDTYIKCLKEHNTLNCLYDTCKEIMHICTLKCLTDLLV